MKLRLKLNNDRGQTITETLMVTMIMSIAAMALTGFSTMVTQTEVTNKKSFGILNFRAQLIQNLTDSNAWNNTLAAAANGQNPNLACIVEMTDCSSLLTPGTDTSFKVYNSNNNVFYDPSAGSNTGGFNQMSQTCQGFNASNANASCPYRYELSWTPLCPSSGSCISPGILIRAHFTHSKMQNLVASNSSLYDIQIFGVSPTPTRMRSFDDTFYTNINTPIDMRVLANDVGIGNLTIKAITSSAHGGSMSINADQSVRYTPSASPAPGYFGSDTFTYIAEDADGWTSTATVKIKVMTPYTWTGNSRDNKWSTPGNWCGTIPTSGGVVITGQACPGQATFPPQATDYAVFDDTCDTGANCNATIDTNASARALYMAAGFIGTVTQASGQSLQVNSASSSGTTPDLYGYTQYGGSFVGSNQSILVGGDFKLAGGNFTSTSNTLSIRGPSFQVLNSPTFVHNNGLVEFRRNNNPQSIISGNINFYDVTFNARSSNIDLNTGIMQIKNDLLVANSNKSSLANINNGSLIVERNLSCQNSGYTGTSRIILFGTGNQNLDGTDFTWANGNTSSWRRCAFPHLEIRKPSGDVNLLGTVHLTGDYLWYSGNVVVGTADLRFGHGATTVYYVPGPFTYNNVTYYNAGGGEELRDRYSPQNPATFNVGGNLWLNNHSGNSCGDGTSSCWSTYGQINAYGDITAEDSGMGPGPGAGTPATIINVTGSNNQVIKQVNPYSHTIYPGSPEPNYVPGGGGANLPSLVINKTGGNVKLDGPIKISRDFIIAATNAGTVDTSNTDLILRGPDTLTPGNYPYQTVYMDNKNTTTTLNGVLKVSRNLHMTNGYQGSGNYGYAVLNGGSIEVQGDVRYRDFGFNGSTIIKMMGGGRNFESVSGTARLLPMFIDTSGGLPINLVGGPFHFTGNFINKSSIDASAITAYFHSTTIEPNNAVFNTVGICDTANSKALQPTSSCTASNLVGSPLIVSNELRVVKNIFNLNGLSVQGTGLVRVSSGATVNLGGGSLSNTGGLINNGTINP